MSRIKFLFIIILTCISFGAAAQTTLSVPGEQKRDGRPIGAVKSDRSGLIGVAPDMKLPPIEYGQEFDSKTKELEEKMAERSWGSESTAWNRACELNTAEAYQRYIAIYPNGAHRPDASQKLIDVQVTDIFNSDHGNLPKMKWVSEDEDSPSSIITVENGTSLPLTVMYSGEESRSIVISPGLKGTVTLPNGHYRIAASVPSGNVRPFAGGETFRGGSYEVCYVIVPASGFTLYF